MKSINTRNRHSSYNTKFMQDQPKYTSEKTSNCIENISTEIQELNSSTKFNQQEHNLRSITKIDSFVIKIHQIQYEKGYAQIYKELKMPLKQIAKHRLIYDQQYQAQQQKQIARPGRCSKRQSINTKGGNKIYFSINRDTTKQEREMISQKIQSHITSLSVVLYNIYLFQSFVQLIIIMEPFASEQKGLFTFYREQADFEEFLKQRKGQNKMQSEEIFKIQKLNISKSDHHQKYAEKDRIHLKALAKRSINIKSPFEQQLNEKQENIDLKDEEISSKILHLLQRNNPSSIPSENIKSIVSKLNNIEEQQKRKEKHALKMKLYKQAKAEALRNKEATQPSNQIFIPKNDFPFKSNPFQKLALQPRSFSSQLSDYKDQQLSKKNIQHSFVLNRNKAKQILHMSSEQTQNQSPTAKAKALRQLEAIDDLTHKFSSQPLQKVLPKINFKEKEPFVLKRQPYFNIINAQKLMNKYKSSQKMQFYTQKGRNSENRRYKFEEKTENKLKEQILLDSRRSMVLQPTSAKFNIFVDSKKAKIAEMHLKQQKDEIFAQMMKKIHV